MIDVISSNTPSSIFKKERGIQAESQREESVQIPNSQIVKTSETLQNYWIIRFVVLTEISKTSIFSKSKIYLHSQITKPRKTHEKHEKHKKEKKREKKKQKKSTGNKNQAA